MELVAGTKLQAVWFADGNGTKIGPYAHDAKSITVVDVAGQCGWVPWAHVERNDGRISLDNLAHAHSVELLKEAPNA